MERIARELLNIARRLLDVSPREKRELVDDFELWSGGRTPDEAHGQMIDRYVDTAMPDKFKRRERQVRKFLHGL